MSRRELLKGNIQTVILALLRDGRLHGYGLAQQILRKSAGGLRYGEGSIYPALHRLERDGLIHGEWESASVGPNRKLFSITDSGLAELARREREWRDLVRAINLVMQGDSDAQPI